jgi:predicted NUDIX family NTP pyrophosphohydrolase
LSFPLPRSPRKTSAGLLPYRIKRGRLEVFLGHMGGPFWAKRDAGDWSIIKGEHDAGEEPFAAACREFEEETGLPAPLEPAIELGEIRQPSGKLIAAWAVEGELDAAHVKSNTFTIEWPLGSGSQREFPEIDRASWFDATTARSKLVKGQLGFIDRLEQATATAVRDRGRRGA